MAHKLSAEVDDDRAVTPTIDGASPDQERLSFNADTSPRVGISTAPPTRIGRYVVLRPLGEGGMGVVYLAYDADLDRKVAIKLMRGGSSGSRLARERVQKEAQTLAQVSHSNIVHVYEVGQSGDEVFIAMEYVPGISLRQFQRPPAGMPPPSIEKILRVYLQAATGLYAAHRRGLIHRDFKPDNVLLGEDDRARVLDFGLAQATSRQDSISPALAELTRRLSAGERLTQAGAIAGTLGYMSPEQVCGADADARSDQFSFCAALYEALYGQLPFAAQSFEEYAADILAGRMRPPPPRDVPIAVEQALRRGLSTEPEARFASMQELIAEMESGLHPDSESPSTRRANRRFRLLVTLIVVATATSGLRHRFASIDRPMSAAVLLLSFLLIGLGAVLFFLRKTLLRRASYRRMAYFCLLLVFYMFSSRLLAQLLGIKLNHYVPLELMGLGALLAVEAPHATHRYRWLAALCYLSGWIVFLIPRLPIVLVNGLYLVIGVSILYYRLLAETKPPDSAGR